MEGTHSPAINEFRVPGLDLVIASSTSYGLHKKTELVDTYCYKVEFRM